MEHYWKEILDLKNYDEAIQKTKVLRDGRSNCTDDFSISQYEYYDKCLTDLKKTRSEMLIDFIEKAKQLN